jgi:hypothetical protein
VRKYWDYYRSIEDDLIQASRYVEFCKQNYKCYSIHFARIITTAGSELDMAFKELCGAIDKRSDAGKINQYRSVIRKRFPSIHESRRYVRGYGLIIQPFSSWATGKTPDWWRLGFNKLKHERNRYFDNANLENALNVVSALMIILFHYYSIKEPNHREFGILEAPRLIIPYRPNNPDGSVYTYLEDFLK